MATGDLNDLTITADEKMKPILESLNVRHLIPRGDAVLVLGLKQATRRIASPNLGNDPMDRPSRGLVLGAGPKARESSHPRPDGSIDTEVLIPGMVCYFGKFEGSEIEIGGRMFYLVEAAKVRAVESVNYSQGEIQKLTETSYQLPPPLSG